MREFKPVPETSGALQPPNRYPPTAVGVDTPEPQPRPEGVTPSRRHRSLLSVALKLAVGLPLVALKLAVRAVRQARPG